MSRSEKAKLNPLVQPSGAVKRLHEAPVPRGGTPQVFIQNPETPFFDPYNHDFPQSNSNVHNQSGIDYSGGWTALHAAAQAKFAGPHDAKKKVEGDLQEARFVIEGLGHHIPPAISLPHYSSPKVEVNSGMTKSGLTPLHVAVKAGHSEMARLLLSNRARVDVQDHAGRTALHHACETGQTECLKALLEVLQGLRLGELRVELEGAEIGGALPSNESLSFHADVKIIRNPQSAPDIQKTSTKFRTQHPRWDFEYSLKDCTPDSSLSIQVIRQIDEEETVFGTWSADVTSAVATKGPVEILEVLEKRDPSGEEEEEEEPPPPPRVTGTVLLRANFVCIVDIQDKCGKSALMLCAEGGFVECVRMMLDSGANPRLKDIFSATAAYRAAQADQAESCSLVEAKGGGW